MGRSKPPGDLAHAAANDNGPFSTTGSAGARATRAARLCGTVIALPETPRQEIRALHEHRARYAAAVAVLTAGRTAFQEKLDALA